MKFVARFCCSVLAIIVIAGLCGECWLSVRDYDYNSRRFSNHLSIVKGILASRSASERSYDPQKRNALVLGCSFTKGIGVSATENYVAVLNRSVPGWNFTNAGLSGYGAYSALLALRQELSQHSYDLVIYAPIANHLRREQDISFHLSSTAPTEAESCPTALELAATGEQSPSQGTAPNLTDAEEASATFPIYINAQLQGVTYRSGGIWWPGDDRWRLINFLRLAYMDSRFAQSSVNDSLNEEKRYATIMRTMYTWAQLHQAKFAVTALFGFNCARPDDNHLRYQKLPITAFTNVALIPGETPPPLKAWDISYPQNILDDPQLHTVPSVSDRGDHPSAIVHSYYAQQIAKLLPEMLAPNIE